jgi:hypothetical protein
MKSSKVTTFPRGIPNVALHEKTVSERVPDGPRVVSDLTGTLN